VVDDAGRDDGRVSIVALLEVHTATTLLLMLCMLNAFSQQQIDKAELSKLYDEALKDTNSPF